jgi:tol-pal system protein YbgF
LADIVFPRMPFSAHATVARMSRGLLALAVVFALASGCATRSSVRQFRAELTALRAEVAALRQAHDEQARESARALQELRALEARVRDVGGAVTAPSEAVGRLGSRVTAVEEGIKDVRADLAARPAPAAPPLPPPPAPERPARDGAPRAGAAEAAYNIAVATFRAREHGQAVLEFTDFLAKYSRHPLAPSAQYWIGEAYYIQRDYRQAIVEFEKVPEQDSVNGKAADALLRIGLCYANLREPARAHQVWQRLVQEHPDSEAAGRARGLLRARRSSSRP